MKIKNMYLNRLHRFYFHLGVHHAEERLEISKGNSKISHASGVLNKLPFVFCQWEMDADGNARLKSNPELCTLTAAGHFFNLSVEELFSLFVPKYNEIFFGADHEIKKKSDLKDLLANMLGFIHVKLETLKEDEHHKELEEKIILKNKRHDKNIRKHQMSQLWA
jgi:hypothetical protein